MDTISFTTILNTVVKEPLIFTLIILFICILFMVVAHLIVRHECEKCNGRGLTIEPITVTGRLYMGEVVTCEACKGKGKK